MIYKLPILAKATAKPYFYSHLKPIDPTKYTSFPVQHYDLGQRLDRYLKNTEIGWISCQKYLRNKDILVQKKDGSLTSANNHRFEQGDCIMIKVGKDIEQLFVGDKNLKYTELDQQMVKTVLDSMTVFDNPNITVLNKLPGYSVQGGPEPQYNLFSLMASRYKKDMIYISHRLDKPTTGLVMISKNVQTAKLIGQALQERVGMDKYYLAMSEGSQILEKNSTISCQLEWTNKHKSRIADSIAKAQNTQLGVTQYVRLRQKQLSDILWRNLLGLKLVTGKKHQIRCQLSQYLLNPILNDQLYLGRKTHKQLDSAIFLHSFGLKITKPQILSEVFGIKDLTNKTIADNAKGTMKIMQQKLYIIGHLPAVWEPYSDTIDNSKLQATLQQIEMGIAGLRKISPALKIQ